MTGTCENEFVDVFLGNGDGTVKTVQSSVLFPTDVTFIGFGDLNGDGKPDLAMVDPDGASATVMLRTGDGTFHLFGIYETEGTSFLACSEASAATGKPILRSPTLVK